MVRVSVVVPVWNNRLLTRDCLESLRAQPSRSEFRVVVVDNGSTDGVERDLRDAADRGDIDLVRNEVNLGYARATNQGIAVHPETEFVLLLNNDTIALPGWLDGLVDELDSHSEADIAGSLLLYEDRETIQHAGMDAVRIDGRLSIYHRWQYRRLDRTPQAIPPGDVSAVTGASMLVRREAFLRSGVLSESYLNGFEDLDFCWRIRRDGRKIRYAPGSRLVHLESRTPGRRAREAANQALFQKCWGDSPVEPGDGFAEDLDEVRLRRRLETEPGHPRSLVKLRNLVAAREDGEAEELDVRLAASKASPLRKWLARRFA